MKILIKEKKIAANIGILAPWLAKEQLKVSGYKVGILEVTLPNEDVTIADFQAIEAVAAGYEDYPIWVEIENQYANNNLPAGLSFATYDDVDDNGNPITVTRKVLDMEVRAVGSSNTIYYLDGITSNITKGDLDIMVGNAVTTVLSLSEMLAKVNDEEGEYFVG